MADTNSLSDVIKYLESKLKQIVDLRKRGYDLRQEAISISKQADSFVSESEKIESEALEIAISRLGEEQGKMAYSLVISTITNELKNDDVASAFIKPKDNRSKKIEIFGVMILEKYKSEADEIIKIANDSSVLENPYSSDRGKNAWRRLLFNCVREKKIENGNNNLESTKNIGITRNSFKSHTVPKFLKGL